MIEDKREREATATVPVQRRENHISSPLPQNSTKQNPAPKVQVKRNEAGASVIAPIGDAKAFFGQLNDSLGTGDTDLASHLLTQLVATQREATSKDMNAGIAILHGIQPRDTLESLLAAQMVNVHNLALEFMHRVVAKADAPTAVVDSNMNRAVKLMGLYTRQIEVWGKYRNRGQQNVVVQHVNVTGGQTIVGNVNPTNATGGRGEGACGEKIGSTL